MLTPFALPQTNTRLTCEVFLRITSCKWTQRGVRVCKPTLQHNMQTDMQNMSETIAEDVKFRCELHAEWFWELRKWHVCKANFGTKYFFWAANFLMKDAPISPNFLNFYLAGPRRSRKIPPIFTAKFPSKNIKFTDELQKCRDKLLMYLVLSAPNRAVWLRLRFVIRIANRKSLHIWDSVNHLRKAHCFDVLYKELALRFKRRFEPRFKSQIARFEKLRFELRETAIWGKFLRFGLRDFKSFAICDLWSGALRPCPSRVVFCVSSSFKVALH